MLNAKDVMDHLMAHQKYPATKAQLVAECNNLSHFSDEDKKEFMDKLPEGNYTSAEEVMKALGMSEPPMSGGMGGGTTGGMGGSM